MRQSVFVCGPIRVCLWSDAFSPFATMNIVFRDALSGHAAGGRICGHGDGGYKRRLGAKSGGHKTVGALLGVNRTGWGGGSILPLQGCLIVPLCTVRSPFNIKKTLSLCSMCTADAQGFTWRGGAETWCFEGEGNLPRMKHRCGTVRYHLGRSGATAGWVPGRTRKGSVRGRGEGL